MCSIKEKIFHLREEESTLKVIIVGESTNKSRPSIGRYFLVGIVIPTVLELNKGILTIINLILPISSSLPLPTSY